MSPKIATNDLEAASTEADASVEALAEARQEVTEAASQLAEQAGTTAAAAAEEIAQPVDQAIDAVTARQQDAIEAVEAAGATVIENVTLAQRAIADFVSTRIREDIEAQQKLLRCKSFDELRAVHSTFVRTAVEQYRDNAARLFKLGQDIVARSTQRAH